MYFSLSNYTATEIKIRMDSLYYSVLQAAKMRKHEKGNKGGEDGGRRQGQGRWMGRQVMAQKFLSEKMGRWEGGYTDIKRIRPGDISYFR